MQEDESYLNKRGLAHFWENIDALKQDKLTAGANITIASDNTISASQPTVNNATLTIQKEGASVGTFTANASTNSTVNIIETDPTVPAWAKASSKPTYSWTEITNKPTIPTKTSDLTNDSGFLTSTDYATASTGGVIKVGGGLEITNGVLSATGGGTADAVEWTNVLNRPTDVSYWTNDAGYITSSDLPTVGNATLTIQKNSTSVGTFTANATSNKTINITVPTTAADVSALPASTKYGASIAVSINTTDYKVTTTLKDQDGNTLGTAQVIDLPLESVVVNGSYDNTNKKIVLTLQSGSTIDIPVADLVAGLQSEITSTNKLSSDLVDDTNHTHKFVTAAQVTKLNGIAAGAEVNVQSDWDQTTTTADDYIKNKPSLATVATSGSYNDLSNKPTIPTVNNGQLTIQKNGSNVATFTANQSGNSTANISVPTKTSDLTNDGADNTSTYIETDDAQKFAIGQGSTNPVFDEMTPVKTIEWDVSDSTYRPIYQMANTGWTYINMDITVAYRITVTGTNIHSVTDIVDRWHNPISYPITSMFCRTLSTSAATTGLRYLRAVYPVSGYLNNATYPLGTEIAMYNATARHVKIEVFKDNSQVTWNATKPSGPICVSGTYNGNNVMNAYDTRGWRFRQPVQMYATNAGYAGYISDFEAVNTSAGELKTGATALTAGHYAFLADDGLVYDISNTAKNISMCESKVGFMNSGVAANTAISYTYWRAISRPNATQVGYIPHDTFALGNRVFLRCTMDANGNVHSNNRLSTTMSAGYTWMPFGWARSATTLYVDTRFPMFYTLDANGKLTHINGKEVAGSEAASVAWEDITGKPTFATVATSGSYNDLSNKPTIPTVNNATLTIQKNGTTVKTFTANASSNVTANITVPTAVSELDNDSGYQTAAQVQTAVDGKQDELTAGDHIDITNDVISATDYVHSENPVSTTAVTPIVTGSMISNGTITADKLATGATIQLTLSTTDIGEGAALAANTLYGVYQ